jgi:predicted small lipoprotein YifL
MFAKFRTILVVAVAAAGALTQSACGQKGDLMLPPDKAAEAARLAQRAAQRMQQPALGPASVASSPASPDSPVGPAQPPSTRRP